MKSEAGITIRPFVYPDDYRAVHALWSTAGPGVHLGPSDAPEEIAKKVYREADLFLVAESRGQIVGTVMGGFDGRRGLIYHLVVSQEMRRSGIGSALMSVLEERLQEKGCLRAYLLVTKDNPDALHFYETIGWETMDILIFGKDLNIQ